MVIVVGVFAMEPGDRARYLEARTAQVVTTRSEPGCLDYSFAADADDPGRVRLLERWESLAALETHVAALRAATSAGRPAVPARTVELTVFTADPVTPPWA